MSTALLSIALTLLSSNAHAEQPYVTEVRKRVKEVFGFQLPARLAPDPSRACASEGRKLLFARKAFRSVHPLYQKLLPVPSNERSLETAFREGWAVYAEELMFPGLPSSRYLVPCAGASLSDEALNGYRFAKSLERKLDRKMIQLLTFDEFKAAFPAWLENQRKVPMNENRDSRSIGTVTMDEDGVLHLTLRAESSATVGDASLTYPKSHPRYAEIVKHVGGLKPGETKPVPPWTE